MAAVRAHRYTIHPAEARAAMSLTRDATAVNGEIVDER
jgi:hypothetical protein